MPIDGHGRDFNFAVYLKKSGLTPFFLEFLLAAREDSLFLKHDAG